MDLGEPVVAIGNSMKAAPTTVQLPLTRAWFVLRESEKSADYRIFLPEVQPPHNYSEKVRLENSLVHDVYRYLFPKCEKIRLPWNFWLSE
jgi:hypothetical protein